MSLPIDAILPALLHALSTHKTAVLQAPPGAGKTTRVPLALLDEPWLQGRRILMLEPRRLAARAAARFMARQIGEPVGQQVGYRTRLDSKISRGTRIEVVTEGILTRILQEDPALESYGAIIFDEFHERSLHADLGLALTLESCQALREDLRVVVMSATLDGEPIARLLGDAPLITSEGRSFPVDVHYVSADQMSTTRHLESVILRALHEQTGSILVFLPGSGEIRKLAEALATQLPSDTFIAPLYGDLSQEAQDAAIQPAAPGERKVVLATSIAETSLTIEGVRVVIDSGLQKTPQFDPVTGLSRLQTLRISQASAEQRKGRAGRTEAGVCYRLWAEGEQNRMAPFNCPEILSADLCDLVLELAQWGVREPSLLAWLDPPPIPAWDQARSLLQRLEALDEKGGITAHGRRLGQWGLHPRLAHMMVKASGLGWSRLGAELAALLSERDVLTGMRHADVQDRIMVLRGEAFPAAQDRSRVHRVRQTAKQLHRILEHSPEQPEVREAAGILLAFAYPDRVGKRRAGKSPRFLLANGRGAFVFDDDSLHDAAFIVAAELDNLGREARVFLAAELSKTAIEEYFGEAIQTRDVVVWDDSAGLVRAQRQRLFGALVVEEKPVAKPDPEAVTHALLSALVDRKLVDLPWDKNTRQWQARVLFLRRLEGETWPDVADEHLAHVAHQWIAPFAQGYTRLSQFKDFPLQSALDALLGYNLQRQLDSKAPSRLPVPSGSVIMLDYESADIPILSVRLQELFGLTQTPQVAENRVAVMLHLLSPSRQPVQVTQDLASFWRNTYLDVRKDLRGRYPKHHWPDDPLTAPATRHAKRRSDKPDR